jgi:hypothetical protein
MLERKPQGLFRQLDSNKARILALAAAAGRGSPFCRGEGNEFLEARILAQ